MTTTARPTLATIADSAGVSVATVSKVLNGRSDVAEETRARVQRVLAAHRYTATPRRRPGMPRAVELLVDHLRSPFTSEVVQGVADAAAEAGVDVTLSTRASGGDHEPTDAEWARRLARTGRCGLISVAGELTREQLRALSDAPVPVVLVDPIDPQASTTPSIGSTNFTGGLSAGQHLIALGHTSIGYVGGALRAACNAARVGGLRAAMEQHGLALDPALVTAGQVFDYETGLQGGLQLLDRAEPPTAVFCGADEVALGVLEAARRVGLRVPQDLSVVGFDDTPSAATSSPPLSTVRQPLEEMGKVALRTVLRLADGGTVDAPHVALATRLVVRASTARREG
ncbi:LacI family DNA-binding transcriptional regulator [Phycicoccus endophyticus]|uniref:LacI family DNA-binding transcriptional regulator n=1 Tax=Phycicoccus endophyticus TaxID=1690220 RepID=A0A7G9QZS9_9MICO|nr:LacI family DNA-binding transcriptional regulator [Phycicoccus endophyticus]NHI20050.1 LacI family transcriptional regulator [Phycicoccus endophyticus]QNN48854.1 LacI family DNA-binding transcriptional regulator [Phycicoccus endophyticus]GGL42281.1 LacI family transcriptional regulator [Phycicoccus endophyticus]